MISFKQLREKCWAGYHAVGMKKKNGKMVPNCVPKSESVSSDDDYRAKRKALQDIQNDPKQMAVVGRDKLLKRKDKLEKDYQDFKNKDKQIAASYNEDAPANAVGDGSGVALPPAVEPGVNVKKKKKDPILGLLKREDYNRVEVENVINKITTSQDVEENQIKPILNNIAKKKEKGTYTEQFGHAAMRYVVDQQTDLPEEQKDEIATSLLAKYE